MRCNIIVPLAPALEAWLADEAARLGISREQLAAVLLTRAWEQTAPRGAPRPRLAPGEGGAP